MNTPPQPHRPADPPGTAVPAGTHLPFRGIAEVQRRNTPSPPASGPAPGHVLTLPRTVEDGRLSPTEDLGDTLRRTTGWDVTVVAGRHGDESGEEEVMYAGFPGAVGRSEETKESMPDSLEGVPPRTWPCPAGDRPGRVRRAADVRGAGQVRGRRGVHRPRVRLGDPGAVGSVLDDSHGTRALAPGDVDLGAFAERVDGIRGEVRAQVR